MNKVLIFILIILSIIIWKIFTIYIPQSKSVDRFTIIKDEIYLKVKRGEYSRFNYKTKECSHWYSLKIVNEILSCNKKNKKILILGVALGGQIIHLLNKDPTIYVTGVDITDEYFYIVRKYSDQNRLKLIKEDAYKYIMNSTETYDVIVCDIFIDVNIPNFVLTSEFLNKINILLPSSNNKFLLNTLDPNQNVIKKTLKNSIKNCSIKLVNNSYDSNNLYFVTKIEK